MYHKQKDLCHRQIVKYTSWNRFIDIDIILRATNFFSIYFLTIYYVFILSIAFLLYLYTIHENRDLIEIPIIFVYMLLVTFLLFLLEIAIFKHILVSYIHHNLHVNQLTHIAPIYKSALPTNSAVELLFAIICRNFDILYSQENISSMINIKIYEMKKRCLRFHLVLYVLSTNNILNYHMKRDTLLTLILRD